MKKILTVTELYFPHGAAMSERIFSFCKLFKEAGFDSHIIAMHSNEEIIPNQVYKYDDSTYQIIKNEERTSIDSFLGSNEFVKQIDLYLKNNKVDYVFCASVHCKFNRVLKTCRKNNVPLILEQCEWYDVSSYKYGYLDYRYIKFNYNIKYNYCKADYIICISRLLEDYYRKQGCKTLRIPSIFDVDSINYSYKTNNEKIKLIYTGYPSKSKDLLSVVIETLMLNSKLLDFYELNIYGTTKDDLTNIYGKEIERYLASIKIHGLVQREEIEEAYANADYQIFIRPSRKSSNAGFSTKFAESMSHAVPVITNVTGDIALFLKDEINGISCDGIDKANIADALERILLFNKKKVLNMRKQARKTAEESFNYKKYSLKIKSFLRI